MCGDLVPELDNQLWTRRRRSSGRVEDRQEVDCCPRRQRHTGHDEHGTASRRHHLPQRPGQIAEALQEQRQGGDVERHSGEAHLPPSGGPGFGSEPEGSAVSGPPDGGRSPTQRSQETLRSGPVPLLLGRQRSDLEDVLNRLWENPSRYPQHAVPQRCCMDRGGDGIRPFPSGSVRRCVRTQAARVRSLCSELSGRPGSP